MKFKLNDYHRDTTDEDLLNDVINTAKKLNKNTLTTTVYTENGKYHHSTLIRRFGNWKNVLELCGLETEGHSFICAVSEKEIIDDVKRVAKIYNKDTITAKEYNAFGKYNSTTIKRKYGNSWNNILVMSDLNVTFNRKFSDKDLIEDIENVWILLGRQPTTTDIKNGISKYSLNSYCRHFGSWRKALEAFIDYIDDESLNFGDNATKEDVSSVTKEKIVAIEDNLNNHKTKRDINLRLRFKVMQRDNFKCCMCGASPAIDPTVVLHIDHIKPWSKGGETTIENLQTLCSKCNLGKGDLEL